MEAAVEVGEVMDASERTECVSNPPRDDVLSETVDMVLRKRLLVDLDCEHDWREELYKE